MIDLYIKYLPELLIMTIILPIVFGCFNVLTKNNLTSYLITLVSTMISFAISLLNFTLRITDIASNNFYLVGNWPSLVGIELRMNQFNSAFLLMATFTAFTVTIYGKRIVESEIIKQKLANFYGCFLICCGGIAGILLTNDLFNLYVFIEVFSLSTYALLAMSNNNKSLKYAYDYLIIGTLAATFILLGIAFLYSATGTVNMNAVSMQLKTSLNLDNIKLGISFFIIGSLVKSALFPFHFWMVNAYNHASSFIVSFFAAISAKIGIYILLCFIYVIVGVADQSNDAKHILALLRLLLGALSVIAMISGSILAVYQRNLRTMLLYSSVSQIGFILLTLSIGTYQTFSIAMILMINHMMATLGLFMICGYINFYYQTLKYNNLNAVAKEMPLTIIAFIINAACIIGLPPTLGFWGKFALIAIILQNNFWLILLAILVTSLLSIVCYWRFIENFYFVKNKDITTQSCQNIFFAQGAIWAITLLSIYFALHYEQYHIVLTNIAKVIWIN